MFNADLLIRDLESPVNEGFRSVVYDDATGKPLKKGDTLKGNPTVGIGWDCADEPLPIELARMICRWQVTQIYQSFTSRLLWVNQLDEVRCRALANMAFNLGIPRLLEFQNTLQALKDGRWDDAAVEALNSRWAKEVGDRAKRIAEVFRTGKEVQLPTSSR